MIKTYIIYYIQLEEAAPAFPLFHRVVRSPPVDLTDEVKENLEKSEEEQNVTSRTCLFWRATSVVVEIRKAIFLQHCNCTRKVFFLNMLIKKA